MNRLVPAALVLLAACVPIPEAAIPPSGTEIVETGFQPLGPGHHRETSLHFHVTAYGADRAREVARQAEDAYGRIMHDTGMYSFVAARPYPIAVYADRREYLEKTRLPEWSAGAAVGNSIVSFEGEHLAGTLTHELTHLLMYEFLGPQSANLRWLNEGLAVYEEAQAGLPQNARLSLEAGKLRVAAAPLAFEQMFQFVPVSEQERLVNLWYRQSELVVRFLIEKGGRLGFHIFLKRLKEGATVDQALKDGFPGQWGDAKALERSWIASLTR